MNQEIDYSQIPLRDIHLPEAVSWWPPAPGWWIFFALLVAAAGWYLYQYVRSYRQRVTLRNLAGIKHQLETGVPPAECLPVVSSVMRRFAMAVAENPRYVAGLVGAAWLNYLDSRWDRDIFQSGIGATLASAPYAPPNACSPKAALALTDVCIEWVRKQRRSK